MTRLTRWLPSRRWLVIPPILIGIGILAAFVLSRRELPIKDAETLESESRLQLQVLTIENQLLQPTAKGYGTVLPSRTWTAIAEVSGRIVKTHEELDSGKEISAEELLVLINQSDYELRVSQRQAELNSALANQQELEASRKADEASLAIENDLLEVSEEELNRQTELKRKRAASTSEWDQARGNLLRQKQAVQKLKNSISLYPARIAAAKASVEMAQSRLAEAGRDLNRTEIVSPFDGVLAGVNLEVEQVVAKNEKLFQVQDARMMEVNAQFSLAQLDKLAPAIGARLAEPGASSNADLLDGLTAELVVRSGDFTRRWTGKPIRIADSIDQQTRTLGVIVQVDNQPEPSCSSADSGADANATAQTSQEKAIGSTGKRSLSSPLRPGTFCEVTLSGPTISDQIAVPRTALDGDSVYVVEMIDSENCRLKKRNVTLGYSIDEMILIEKGLVLNEEIAVRAPAFAIDDSQVFFVGEETRPEARVSDAAWSDR